MFVIDRNGNRRPGSDSSSTGSSPRIVSLTNSQRAISEQQVISEQKVISGLAPIDAGDSGFSPGNDATISDPMNQGKSSNRSKPPVHLATGQSSNSTGHSSIVSASNKSTTQRQVNRPESGLQVKTEQVTHQEVNPSVSVREKVNSLSVKPSSCTQEVNLEEGEDASMTKRQRLDSVRETEVIFFVKDVPRPRDDSRIGREECSIAIANAMKPFHHHRNEIKIEMNHNRTQAKVTFLNNHKDPERLIQEGLSLKFGGYPVPVSRIKR